MISQVVFLGCFCVVFHSARDAQLSDLLDKPGRCASVNVRCSHPNPTSRCFFHFECPGNQLCCSVDGCVNSCVDPLFGDWNSSSYDISPQNHTTTEDEYFHCDSGMRILSKYRCDGNDDCPGMDTSDELDCPCGTGQAQCSNGVCMDHFLLCLPEVSDQQTCTVQNLNCSDVNCPSDSHFLCQNGQCLSNSAKCNGVFNCLDGSDEDSARCECNKGNFVCDGGLCKSRLLTWCNGIADCKDRSDEPADCACVDGQFKCANGKCIAQYQQCDFRDDCLDLSDEQNCSARCSPMNNMFQCSDNRTCIADTQRCDGIVDCPNGDDELDCAANSWFLDTDTPKCRSNQVACLSSNSCFPLSSWCDKIADCVDRSDEVFNCSSTCPTGSFQCDGSRCLPESARCNGHLDCVDLSDETACPCLDEDLPLPNSGCLAASLFCNGISDAYDGLDEEQCTGKQLLHLSNTSKLCDGVADTYDASDELPCGNCLTSEFYCWRSKQCVAVNKTCDGLADCSSYGEDEENCLAMVPKPCRVESDMEIQQSSAGCLAVKNRGDWMPVCAERWSNSLSDAICEIRGYDKSLLTNLIMMDPNELVERPVDQKIPRSIDGPQIVISAAKSCPSRKKVYVECGSVICGQSPSDFYQPHLIDGVAVPDGKYPWTVGLYHHGKMFCGGTIVHGEWLLTSASCVVGMENKFIVARLGAIRRNSLGKNEQHIAIDNIVVNSRHKLSQNRQILSVEADLALLHFETPPHWNDNVKPVCLPTAKYLPGEVVVTGWSVTIGKTKMFTEDGVLEAAMPALDSSKCQLNPLVEASISDDAFCGNLSGAGRCVGDLGGAAMDKNYFGRWSIVGVASFGLGCNTSNSVSGYAFVAPHLEWIYNVTTIMEFNTTKKDDVCVGGIRCSLGTCINPSQMCDGTVDCPLASDETNCSQISVSSQTMLSSSGCSFGEPHFCGFRQDLSDSLNFFRGGLTNSSDFPQLTANQTTTKYIYVSSKMNSTPANYSSSARLFSPKLSTSTNTRCLQITFTVRNDGDLAVYDKADSNRILPTVFVNGNSTREWQIKRMELPSTVNVFVVEANLRAGNDSFVAVQSVALFEESCGLLSDPDTETV